MCLSVCIQVARDRWVAWKGRGRVTQDTPMFEFRLGCRFASVSSFCPPLSLALSFSLFRGRLPPTYLPLLVHPAIRQTPTFDLAGESLVLRRIRRRISPKDKSFRTSGRETARSRCEDVASNLFSLGLSRGKAVY